MLSNKITYNTYLIMVRMIPRIFSLVERILLVKKLMKSSLLRVKGIQGIDAGKASDELWTDLFITFCCLICGFPAQPQCFPTSYQANFLKCASLTRESECIVWITFSLAFSRSKKLSNSQLRDCCSNCSLLTYHSAMHGTIITKAFI